MRSVIAASELPPMVDPHENDNQPSDTGEKVGGHRHFRGRAARLQRVAVLAEKMPGHPRLQNVLAELRMQQRRLRRNRKQGHLTPESFELLKRERDHIRLKALLIAVRHHGKLPLRSFGTLQSSMQKLNVEIRRMLSA